MRTRTLKASSNTLVMMMNQAPSSIEALFFLDKFYILR